MSVPFKFSMPFTVFHKGDAEEGKQRRIGGIASLEVRDRQQELLLSNGLRFDNFLKNGWFNDNHSKATTDILGYPEKVTRFKKGDKLPDKTRAKARGIWVEGYLLDTPKAEEVWRLANALQKTKRRLGFSVEGSVEKRLDDDRSIVASADVRNVAITNCPVNTGSRMEILAKSLQAVQSADVEKALTMGEATPGVKPQGTFTGEGAGKVLAEQSLERKKRKKKRKKTLSDQEALSFVKSRMPRLSDEQARRLVTITKNLKAKGLL
jgi:hypothetical protein